jgi:pimeloyl-ACP methyl ester carboxylesterase
MMDNARLLSLPESAYRNSLGMFSHKDASSITHPTLLLRGDLSPKQFLLAEAELAKYLPDAERVLIPNAAHVLHGMNPEVYSDVVLSFLAKH